MTREDMRDILFEYLDYLNLEITDLDVDGATEDFLAELENSGLIGVNSFEAE